MASRSSTNIHLVADATDSGVCSRCSEPATLVCGRCGDFYCSGRCQRMDWQSHRHVCIELPDLMSASMFYAARDATEMNDTKTPRGPPTSHNITRPTASTIAAAATTTPATTSPPAFTTPRASTSTPASTTPPASTSSPAFKAKPSFNGSSGSTSSPGSSFSSAGFNGSFSSTSSPSASFYAAASKKPIKPPGKDDEEHVLSWRRKPPQQQLQQINHTMPTVTAGRGRGVILSSWLAGPNPAPSARSAGMLVLSDSPLSPPHSQTAESHYNPFVGQRRASNPFAEERRQDSSNVKEFRPGNPFAEERRQDSSNAKEFRPGNPFAGERRQDSSNTKEFRPDNPASGERRQDTAKSTEPDEITIAPVSAIKSGDQVILTDFHSTNRVYVCTEASHLAHQKVRQYLQEFLQKNVLKRLEQRPKLNAFVLVRSEMGQYTRGRVVATTNTGAIGDGDGAAVSVCIELIDIGKQVQRPHDTLYECPGHLAHLRPCTLMVNLYMVNLFREMPDAFGKPFVGRSFILKFPKELKRGSWVELVCPQTGTNLNKTIAKLIKEQQMLQKNGARDGTKIQNASFEERKFELPLQSVSLDEKKLKVPVQSVSLDEKQLKVPVQSVSWDPKKNKVPLQNASYDGKKYELPLQNASYDEELPVVPVQSVSWDPKNNKVPLQNASFDEKKYKFPVQNVSLDEKKFKIAEQIASFDEKKFKIAEQIASFEKKYKMPQQNASLDEMKNKLPVQNGSLDEKKLKVPGQNVSLSEKKLKMFKKADVSFEEKKYKMPEENDSFEEKKYKMPEENDSFEEKKYKMPEENDSFEEKFRMTCESVHDELNEMPSILQFFGVPKYNAFFDEKKKKEEPAENSPNEQKEKKLSIQNISDGDKKASEPNKSLKSLENVINKEKMKMESAQSIKSLQNDENVAPDKLSSLKSMGFPEDGPAFLNGVVRYETMVLGPHVRVHK